MPTASASHRGATGAWDLLEASRLPSPPPSASCRIVVWPFAERDRGEMLQPRRSGRPAASGRGLVERAIAGGVVAEVEWALGAIGDPFDQGRAEIGAGAVGGPFAWRRRRPGSRCRRHAAPAGPKPMGAGDAKLASRSARRRCRGRRDRPLIVDDVEDHRRDDRPKRRCSAEWKSPSAVDPSPIQAEAILSSPACRRRGHRPADRLADTCVPRLPEIEKKP